jgi:hypothetical protein
LSVPVSQQDDEDEEENMQNPILLGFTVHIFEVKKLEI